MADDPETKYRAKRRRSKRVIKKPRKDGRNVVFVCNEVLKEIWVHIDEQNLTGVITFHTRSAKEIRRRLVYTWFAQGIYQVTYKKHKNPPPEVYSEIISAENVDPVILDRLKKLEKDKYFSAFQYIIEGNYPYDQMIDCLLSSAVSREITIRVTYVLPSDGQKGGDIPEKPLSDDYLPLLKNEYLANLYIILLEHFAGINIDEKVAAGGITRKEYQDIIKIKSKDPSLEAKTIARILTQATVEYVRARGKEADDLSYLPLLVEAILYQRKRKNALATLNQLEIAVGLYRLPNGQLVNDLGIKRRGESALLLYDKFGNAIQAFLGYMDTYYRNVDLDKVPMIQIKLGDSAEAQFLRVLEQTFAFPNREIYVFCASMGDFYKFIVEEVARLYNGEIQKRFMEMLPVAIGFFVVHAVVGAMAKRGNPYAIALIVVAKAVGWIMDIDMGITTLSKMAEAGRHFAMMEKIHRRSPQEKGKEKLTKLSLYHLELGTRSLIDAMAELAAMGIFIAGQKLGQKLASPIAKYVTTVRERAKLEIHVENGKCTKVRSVDGKKVIEIEAHPAESVKGIERTTSTGKKLKLVDRPPIEEAGPNIGSRERAHRPTPAKQPVKVMEYKGYKTYDSKGRPASSEAVSGMPDEHMRIAMDVAKEQGVIALFRTTFKPRARKVGIELIKRGHPPKGKELIALNTNGKTGKVTVRNRREARIAMEQGHYVLGKDGYAYRNGQKLRGTDGQPVRFDMQEALHGVKINRPGQVIDKNSKKAFVGDYDLQDVILPSAQGRNIAAVPEKATGDVVAPQVRRFMQSFNSKLSELGDRFARLVHGADAQFIQRLKFRKEAFKGDAIGVMPDGRVVYFSQRELAAFYKAIGRSRLDLPSKSTKLEPYKK
ncbi:MAG: hypothetical protein JSW33_00180 [bacterium]|nr:MAG: hypothetical protein JSW33_00180 [bacterium]